MAMQRHNPHNYRPEDYTFQGWVYLGQSDFMREFDDIHARDVADTQEHIGSNHLGKCDQCGQRYAYGAVYTHKDGGWVSVGQDCASGSFITPASFNAGSTAIRARVAHARARALREQHLAAIIEGRPELGAAFEWAKENTDRDEREFWRAAGYATNTILDIRGKLIRYGNISGAQANLVVKLHEEGVARLAELARRQEASASLQPLEAGRQQLSGTVLSVKDVETQYGVTTKLLLELDSGHRVYGTLPSSIIDASKGDRVSLTATVQPKGNDFGFYSRPSKAKIEVQS